MSLYLIRHAEKAYGEYRERGLALNDQPLSNAGLNQAEKLCGFFSNIDIDRVLTSRYIRTAQTAAPLAKAKGLSPKVDKRLDELDIGVFDRLTETEIAERYPAFWSSFLSRDRPIDFPEGESGAASESRGRSFLDSVKHDETLVAFSHDGLIRSLCCIVLDLPIYRRHLFRADFCSIHIMDYDPDYDCFFLKKLNLTL